MRAFRTAALVAALCASLVQAQKPKTVDEAVQTLKTKWLKPKDLDWVLRNPKDEVVWTLYRPFGTGVRNQFGLWGDNQALRDSCGDKNPEGCSVVILNRLWESVHNDADPSLVRQLDCQFQLAKSIHINREEFHKLTTGELLKALQFQVNDQLAQMRKTSTDVCQDALTLEVEGKRPDMHCFVDAPFSKELADSDNLEKALAGLGSLNLFTSSHVPPKITLNFLRKCQFPTQPDLYGASPRKQR